MALKPALALLIAAAALPAAPGPAPAPEQPSVQEPPATPVTPFTPAPAPPPASAGGPALSCAAALEAYRGNIHAATIPGEVDGTRIDRDGLIALRAARGNATIFLRNGNLEGADFRGARLHNICFLYTRLAGSDWRGAKAPGIGLLNLDMSRARLAGADMRGILIASTNLEDADASGADLSGGSLSGNAFGNARRLRLDGANLSGFRFECGNNEGNKCGPRDGISFRGARLDRARIDARFSQADWTDAVIDRTEIMPEQLLALGAAEVKGPILVRGGDAVATLSPAEYAELRPHLRAVRGLVGTAPVDRELAMERRDPPAWLKPGRRALFVQPRIEFDEAARGGPLYARLLPALIGGAWGHVMVTVDADGLVSARGEAVGGNDHMCGLVADGLRLDPRTGWYSGPHKPWGQEPVQWRGRPKAVIRLRGDRAEVQRGFSDFVAGEIDPRHSDYVMCGARAGFEEMVLVPSAGPEAERLWAEWGSKD